MADRDVEFDIIARDKTGAAAKGAEKNLQRVGKQAEKTGNVLTRGVQQWGRGFQKLGGAANRWANSGDGAGKKFVRGISKGVGKLAEIGGSIGGGLSKAVSAAGPQVALAVTAVLAAAATAAAPLIAGAMVGGAGLGGIVGGVLLASKDARVAGAFENLKEEAGSQLQDAAKRFIPAVLDATKEARKAFRDMLPNLRRIFDVSATWVAPLTRSLGRAANLALDGITKAVVKAGPIVDQIGKGIELVGGAVGKVFADLSDNGASMALAVKAAFILIGGAIENAGRALNWLVEAFEFFVTKIPGGKKLLDSMTESQNGAKGSAYNLAGGFQQLATDANGAAAGLTNAKQKADEFAENNLSLRDAQIAARDAIKSATATIKENGEAKGFNSAKGRENEKALNDLARAFNAETDAGDKSGRSARDAAAAYSTNRTKLIAMAEKAGYSKTQAELLAAQLLKMPKNVNTDVNVNTGAAETKLVTFQRKINGLHGKTVVVTVQQRQAGDHVSGKGGSGTLTRRWGGIDYAMARGGALEAHFAKSPTVLFGERETGGEAFIPRRGDLGRSRSIAETVVRDWLGGQVSWGGQGAAVAAGPEVLELHLDLGHGIQQVVQVNLRQHDRQLKRRVGAGVGR